MSKRKPKAKPDLWYATTNGKASHKAYRATAKSKAIHKVSGLEARCRKVGITVEQYNFLPKKCSFEHCSATVPGGNGDWHLDHDHTKTVDQFRGLLCNQHNLGLGHFKDSREALQDAIDYLDRYHGKQGNI